MNLGGKNIQKLYTNMSWILGTKTVNALTPNYFFLKECAT